MLVEAGNNGHGGVARVDVGLLVDVLLVLVLFDNVEGGEVVVLVVLGDDALVVVNGVLGSADDDEDLEWEAALGALGQAQPGGEAEDLLGLREKFNSLSLVPRSGTSGPLLR